MTKVYYCAIKIAGFPFVVLTEEEAKEWVSEDPETHYYREIEVKKLSCSSNPE